MQNNFTRAQIIGTPNNIKGRLWTQERPYQQDYLANVDFQVANSKWQSSFVEYPCKNEEGMREYLNTISSWKREQQDEFLKVGIDIDPKRIKIEKKSCSGNCQHPDKCGRQEIWHCEHPTIHISLLPPSSESETPRLNHSEISKWLSENGYELAVSREYIYEKNGKKYHIDQLIKLAESDNQETKEEEDLYEDLFKLFYDLSIGHSEMEKIIKSKFKLTRIKSK